MTTPEDASKLDRYQGCILGLAIGDALGYPTEFRSRRAILESFPPNGVSGLVRVHDERWPARPIIVGKNHPAGTYTDDTQMTLAIAEGLIEAGDQSLDDLMEAIGRRFVEWSRSPENNRAPGNTCMTGCQNLARGVPWREAGVARSKGCGSAMRVAPIGLFFADDIDRLLEVARASSILTHGHPAGIEGAAAAALLVKLALDGKEPSEMYEIMMSRCGGRSEDFDRCLEKLPGMLEEDPAFVLSENGLGEAWVAEEAVASALYCFWRSPRDYEKTVRTAANTDGDSDSIACIAGGISGAFNGLDAIPERWREQVENSAALHELAKTLREASETANHA